MNEPQVGSEVRTNSINLFDSLTPDKIAQEYFNSNVADKNFDAEIEDILSEDDMDIADINELIPELNLKALCNKAEERHTGIQIETDKPSAEPLCSMPRNLE